MSGITHFHGKKMMNRLMVMKKLFVFASLLAIVAGCTKEVAPIEEPAAGSYTLFAEFAPSTKSTINDETGAMTWSANDHISVLSDDGEVNADFMLSGGQPTSVGVFTGDFEGTPVFAVYPYNEDNIAVDTEVDINLPAEYVYDGESTHAPMVASIESTSEVTEGTAKFEHIAGLIKVTYENVPSTAKKFTFTAAKGITGSFAVESKMITASEGNENNVVTYTFAEASETMSFYVPVPCGIYGFSIALYDGADNKIAKSGKKVSSTTIERGTYYIAPTIVLPVPVSGSVTENFSSSGATTNNYDCSSSISTAANRTDFDFTWTLTGSGTVFKNGIKLGAKAATGSVTSSDILNDIPNGTPFTVKVYAAVWSPDSGKVCVTYNGNTITSNAANPAITATTSAYSASDFSNSTDFVFTKADATELTIASSSKRILVDKVEVVWGGASQPTLPVLATVNAIYNKAQEVNGTATDVNVTFGNWFVTGVTADGKNVYVSNGDEGFIIFDNGANMGFEVGDVLSGTATCQVKMYNKAAELLNLKATTKGLTITKDGVPSLSNVALKDLSGINTGSIVSFGELLYDGTNLNKDNVSLSPYYSIYTYSGFENGKNYDVKGVYLQFGDKKEILPRSSDDISLSSNQPGPSNYEDVDCTIEFVTSSSDGSTTLAANASVTKYVSSGTEFISGFTSTCSKAYGECKSGIKLGSSSSPGTLEFNVANSYKNNVVGISVNSVKYGSEEGQVTVYAGDTQIAQSSPGSEISGTFAPKTVSSIKITSTKRSYVSSVTITIRQPK